jgi:DNA modification methylase
MRHELYCEDALKKFLPDSSVDMFLLSPTFFDFDSTNYGGDSSKQINIKNNYKKFLKNLIKVTQNAESALKEFGNILVVLPTYNIDLLPDYIDLIKKKTKLDIHPILIWSHYTPHERNVGQFSFDYSNVIHLSKNSPKYDSLFRKDNQDPVFKIPLNFLETEPYGHLGFVGDNMPLDTAKWLINNFSMPGDTVADLFGGTGTTSVAAEILKRNSVYVDCSEMQFNIAQTRVNDVIEVYSQ